MSKALLFAGQGAQFVGMGADLYERHTEVKEIFEAANDHLGYRITDIMFNGEEETLRQTSITQPALYVHSMAFLAAHDVLDDVTAMAGHSLGECTALAASGVVSFIDGLSMVDTRARAMQQACDDNPGTMAAIVGLEDRIIEELCNNIENIVIPANYNSPGQLVISGSLQGIDEAVEKCTELGAKRAIKLSVAGAFHSPLMASARDAFSQYLESITFNTPKYPIFQNVTGHGVTDTDALKQNLIDQITAPVLWSQSMVNMVEGGVDCIQEIGGNGKVLSGLMRRINREVAIIRL